MGLNGALLLIFFRAQLTSLTSTNHEPGNTTFLNSQRIRLDPSQGPARCGRVTFKGEEFVFRAQELPSHFHLEGPLLYSRSGSSEVSEKGGDEWMAFEIMVYKDEIAERLVSKFLELGD